MKVLITGGAGFLGLHIARYFSKKNAKVTLLDISPINKLEYPKQAVFIRADIRNKKKMYAALRGKDVVIHAAAALPLWKKEDIFEINVEGTRNLLEACIAQKVKHFIFISSTAVYGIPKKHPIYEKDRIYGVGPYGESKIQAERLCEEYRRKGLIVTIIRPKTFLGTHRLGVFEILFDWVKDGKKIPVIGSGNNRYQLLDVDDLVSALYKITTIKNKNKVNETFNIAAEKFTTVEQDLETFFKKVGSRSHILATPAFLVKAALFIFEKLHVSPLYQWVYATADKDSYVSISRLKKAIGWRPKYSNAQALIKAYRWYERHYKEIKSRPAGITHTVGWKQGILRVFKRFL